MVAACLLQVGELTTPPSVCVEGAVVWPVPNGGADGPWTVDVTLRGPTDGSYYAPFRVRLEFNAAYPMFPPEVRPPTG
jgi:ubiquitin-protein ligase